MVQHVKINNCDKPQNRIKDHLIRCRKKNSGKIQNLFMTLILSILCTKRTNLKASKAICENLAINVILNGEKLK